MTKRIAIFQSNYIPWRGYFDVIGLVDEFLILDTVQYTKNDWRNRNRIPSKSGGIWLTIPVRVTNLHQRIDETEVDGTHWTRKHLTTLRQSYARAPYFNQYVDQIASLYERARDERLLTSVNLIFLREICHALSIRTPIILAPETMSTDRTARLIELCQGRQATSYLSGPAARAYIDQEQFITANIGLEFMDYGGYPAYRQLCDPFDLSVSVLDLLFNVGPEARTLLKCGQTSKGGGVAENETTASTARTFGRDL